jgi:ABC-type hemin transport system substrate-binding protein
MVKAGVPLMAVQGKMRQDGMGEKEVATVCGVTESGTTSTAQTVKRVERVERVSDSKTSNQGARPQLASVPKITEERGSLLASIRAGGIATLKKSPTPKSSEKKSAAPVNPMMAAILARRKRQ